MKQLQKPRSKADEIEITLGSIQHVNTVLEIEISERN